MEIKETNLQSAYNTADDNGKHMYDCPNFKKKTKEQLEEQYRIKQNNKKGDEVL